MSGLEFEEILMGTHVIEVIIISCGLNIKSNIEMFRMCGLGHANLLALQGGL